MASSLATCTQVIISCTAMVLYTEYAIASLIVWHNKVIKTGWKNINMGLKWVQSQTLELSTYSFTLTNSGYSLKGSCQIWADFQNRDEKWRHPNKMLIVGGVMPMFGQWASIRSFLKHTWVDTWQKANCITPNSNQVATDFCIIIIIMKSADSGLNLPTVPAGLRVLFPKLNTIPLYAYNFPPSSTSVYTYRHHSSPALNTFSNNI